MKKKKISACIYYALHKLEFYKHLWMKIKNAVHHILRPLILRQKFNFRKYRKRNICPSMTIAIDLDETLIYCTKKRIYSYQKEVDVLINGKYISLYVCKRPYVDQFFSSLHPLYEIIIFTTSIKSYADTMLNIIDIEHFIDKTFYREDCYELHQYYYIKNLVNIKKEISKIVLIDDSDATSYSYPGNFFPVTKWNGNLNDTELLDIIPFFLNLKKVNDIRSICSFRLKTQKEISKLITTSRPDEIQNYQNKMKSFYQYSIAFQAINYLKFFMHKFKYASSKEQWNELGKKINIKLKSCPLSLSKMNSTTEVEPKKRRKTTKKKT